MKVLKWINVNFEPVCMSLTFYLTVALITIQVILRFAFQSGFAWGEEISRFLFVWSMFLAFPYISRNNKHVGVGFVRDLFGERVRKVLLVLVDLLTIGLVFFLLKGTVGNVITTISFHDRATSLNISMNWLYMAPVAGYMVMLLRTVQTFFWKLRHFTCSYELFCNLNGCYNGADALCFLNASGKEELVKARNADALAEETERFKRKGGFPA